VIFAGCEQKKPYYTGGNPMKPTDSPNTDFNDVPEADLDTINKTNKQSTSPKPLDNNNSQINMKVKSKKDVLSITIENKSDHNISFDGKYVLYRYDADKWKNIEYLPNVVIPDIEYVVKKDAIFSDKISFLNIFGELKNGNYKIEKEIESVDSRSTISAEFEIR
jgi:hypothetical protein